MIKVQVFIWLDDRVGEALDFYESVFEGSSVVDVNRISEDSVMVGTLRLPGCEVMLFHAGDFIKPNEATSLFVTCDTQEEVDHLWNALCAGGPGGRCGWVTDPFGVTWQIVPKLLGELMGSGDMVRAVRVREAMMQMGRLDGAVLQAAYDGVDIP